MSQHFHSSLLMRMRCPSLVAFSLTSWFPKASMKYLALFWVYIGPLGQSQDSTHQYQLWLSFVISLPMPSSFQSYLKSFRTECLFLSSSHHNSAFCFYLRILPATQRQGSPCDHRPKWLCLCPTDYISGTASIYDLSSFVTPVKTGIFKLDTFNFAINICGNSYTMSPDILMTHTFALSVKLFNNMCTRSHFSDGALLLAIEELD